MVRHRCTRCKKDVGQYGTRHKWKGGVYCDRCLMVITGVRVGGGGLGGFFSGLLFRLIDLIHHIPDHWRKRKNGL